MWPPPSPSMLSSSLNTRRLLLTALTACWDVALVSPCFFSLVVLFVFRAKSKKKKTQFRLRTKRFAAKRNWKPVSVCITNRIDRPIVARAQCDRNRLSRETARRFCFQLTIRTTINIFPFPIQFLWPFTAIIGFSAIDFHFSRWLIVSAINCASGDDNSNAFRWMMNFERRPVESRLVKFPISWLDFRNDRRGKIRRIFLSARGK